jgi:two-component sensor histidine kinase
LYSSVKKANQKIETLIKELNHRVKNNLQLVSNMLHLQKRTAKDATQMALIQASINRVQSMNIINGLLYKKDFSGLVQMKGFVEALVSNLSYAYKDSANEFEVTLVIDELQLDIEKAIPVGLIVNELITNIYKYGKASEKKSEIEIKLCRNNANWTLEVIDNCKYWDVESEKAKKIGLGLFLIDIFVKQLCGIWRAVSNENGSNHWIEFKA